MSVNRSNRVPQETKATQQEAISMTDDTTSTRPAGHRRLGPLIGAVICATMLALAPSASAQTGANDGVGLPTGPSELLGGLPVVVTETVTALPHTLADPLGGPDAPGAGDMCEDLEGIGPFLSCIIDRLDSLFAQRAPAP
jgi:hypothetical protein